MLLRNCNDGVLGNVLLAVVIALWFLKTYREKASKQNAGKFQQKEQLKYISVSAIVVKLGLLTLFYANKPWNKRTTEGTPVQAIKQ